MSEPVTFLKKNIKSHINFASEVSGVTHLVTLFKASSSFLCCQRTVTALAELCGCAGCPEPSTVTVSLCYNDPFTQSCTTEPRER